MNRRSAALVALVVGAALVVSWLLFITLPRLYYARQHPAPPGTTSPAIPGAPRRTIKATLFYATADGQHLTGVSRDVELGDTPLEQARWILESQLHETTPNELLATIPAKTSLRGVYVTDRGEAYVDLSVEVASAHPGGSLNEILTVYTIVHALTANMPLIKAVQILVDGREVDTLAGHIDLRRPLHPILALMESKSES